MDLVVLVESALVELILVRFLSLLALAGIGGKPISAQARYGGTLGWSRPRGGVLLSVHSTYY